MASLSVSPSAVSRSPTIVHYHQQQSTFDVLPHCPRTHRRGRRRYRPQKQPTHDLSRVISTFDQEQYQNHRSPRPIRINKRRPSPRFGSAASLWEVHRSSTGRIYYYNVATDRSQWERPPREHRFFARKNVNRRSKRNSHHDNHFYEREFIPSFENSRRKISPNSIATPDDGIDSALLRQANYHTSSHFSTKHRSHISESSALDTMTTNNHKRHHSKHHHHHHHHKRKKHSRENKSSLQKRKKSQLEDCQQSLSALTPTSPPADEIIRVDLVDPVLTPSISNVAIPPIDPRQRHQKTSFLSVVHTPPKEVIIDDEILQLLHRKRLTPPTQINQDEHRSNNFSMKLLSNTGDEVPSPINDLSFSIVRSSLRPSASTINAILELGHSPPSTNISTVSDDITRYYRGELIEHLLNWPSTQIERETARLSNEQARITVGQLVSLRTEIFCSRFRFERNRIQLLQYQHALIYRQQIIEQLQRTEQQQTSTESKSSIQDGFE